MTTDPRAPQVGETVTAKDHKDGKEFIVGKGEDSEYSFRLKPAVDCFAVWNASLNELERVYMGADQEAVEDMLAHSYENQGSSVPDLRLVHIEEVADVEKLFKSRDKRLAKEAKES